jgi:hypothetical protein
MRTNLHLAAPREVQREALEAALEGLTALNAVLIARSRVPIPHPYESGVRYRREPRGREDWNHVARLLRLGHGDCEDLAAYLAAWLRIHNAEPARVVIRRTGPRLWHAVVQRADGRIEDPSKVLGMRPRRRALAGWD